MACPIVPFSVDVAKHVTSSSLSLALSVSSSYAFSRVAKPTFGTPLCRWGVLSWQKRVLSFTSVFLYLLKTTTLSMILNNDERINRESSWTPVSMDEVEKSFIRSPRWTSACRARERKTGSIALSILIGWGLCSGLQWPRPMPVLTFRDHPRKYAWKSINIWGRWTGMQNYLMSCFLFRVARQSKQTNAALRGEENAALDT